MREIERQAARYMTDLADAIAAVKSGKSTYGEFHVQSVFIGFEGDDTGYRIVPNEHGDYSLTEVDTRD